MLTSKISKRAFFGLCEYVPHRGQEQIHAAVEMPGVDTVVAACGARFGKTMAAGFEMSFQSLLPRKDFMGWCIGPDHKLADLVFDQTYQILRKFLKGNVRFSGQEGIIEFSNLGGGRSRVMRRSADRKGESGTLVGYPVDFMVIDEAARIADDTVWENQLRTRLIDRAGRVLMISSPRGTRGFFPKLYRMARRGDPTIIGIRLPSWTNPHGHVRAAMKNEKRRMDRRAFMQEYAAAFIAAEGLVFDPDEVAAISTGTFEPFDPRYEYFGGLDLAMTHDYTVLTIIRAARPDVQNDRAKIVYMQRFNRMPVEQQLMVVKDITDRYGECQLYVDETGLGKPILEQMMNLGLPVRGVVWTYAEKAGMIRNSMVLIEKHAIELPTTELAPSFHDELSVFGWHSTEKERRLTASAPAGATDDCIASFIMACKWIRAAGTMCQDRAAAGPPDSYRAPAAPEVPSARPIARLIVKGDAVPDAQMMTQRVGAQRRDLWTNSLFGGSF